jgi:PPOX class probable F420-dependent enzyme
MPDDEVRALLGEPRSGILTTLSADGWPHPSAMWFVDREDGIWMWTYAKSQKAVNLRRDPRCSFLVEAGEMYGELRGVILRAKARLVTDYDDIVEIGKDLYERYVLPRSGAPYEGAPRASVEQQAHKRVGIVVPYERVASWRI